MIVVGINTQPYNISLASFGNKDEQHDFLFLFLTFA
jgi:hypothetical protein